MRAVYIVGHNPAETDPDTHCVVKALQAMEFVVVTRAYSPRRPRSSRMSFSPPPSFAEKEGTFTNADRRVQRVRKVVEPLPGCRTDVEIICDLADRMGYAMPARTAPDIMDEIASLVPVMAGIDYRRLDQQPLVWPCIDRTAQGTRGTLRAELSARACDLPMCRVRRAGRGSQRTYPLILTTGRRLEHYNCGSMTRRTPGLVELADEERLDINPHDAEPLNVHENQMVEVASRLWCARRACPPQRPLLAGRRVSFLPFRRSAHEHTRRQPSRPLGMHAFVQSVRSPGHPDCCGEVDEEVDESAG